MSNEVSSKIKSQVRALPHKPGVYLMKDRLGNVIYVGKAKDLKKRVSTYFQPSRKNMIAQPKVRSMIPLITHFETIEVKSEAEALLLEGKLLKEYKPKYNTDFVDNKQFLLVKVDVQNPLPRFRLVRNRNDQQSQYYGPFARAGMLKKTLREMRSEYGILLADARPEEIEPGRYRLYDDMRREIYGHENTVTVESYAERVKQGCEFLEGKSREYLKELEEQMQEKAAEHRFEEAAELRDLVKAMRLTLERTKKFSTTVNLKMSPEGVLERLKEALSLDTLPNTVECFDISHTGGSFVVASMVSFKGGKPSRGDYRRFRIKGFVGNDDFRSMEEVVGRRYQRLHDEGKAFPDLLVVDGGKGQVTAALRAFLILDIEPPPMIGLAKKLETIIFPDNRPPLNLPHDDPALFLLQRIRDEAHRFANTFNAELRSKKIRETILMDFQGLGKVRRTALMDKFKSLDRLKKASIEELQTVEGIGRKLATQLKEFLESSGNSSKHQKPSAQDH